MTIIRIIEQMSFVYTKIKKDGIKVGVLKTSPRLNAALVHHLESLILYLGKSSDVKLEGVSKITQLWDLPVVIDGGLMDYEYQFMTKFKDDELKD